MESAVIEYPPIHKAAAKQQQTLRMDTEKWLHSQTPQYSDSGGAMVIAKDHWKWNLNNLNKQNQQNKTKQNCLATSASLN